ncbi:MAG: hypothetical protein VYB61_02285 [Verrucomicrobiota bacterium]|nr:hypothetical protein [Verrucomicrobiota bacterium]
MSLPTRIAEKDPDDPVSEALESLGQSGADRGHDFPGSGAFTDPDVVAALANLPAVKQSEVPAEFSPGDGEVVTCLEDGDFPAVQSKRNRRGRSSFWLPLLVLGLVQVAIVLSAVVLVWPELDMKLHALDSASSSLQKIKNESRVLQKRLEVSEQRIDSLLTEVVEMKSLPKLNPDEVRAEFEYLGERNRFIRLADAAILNADRSAFDELLKRAAEVKEGELRNGAIAEINRVRFAYLNGLRSSGFALPVGELFPSLRGKDEMELQTDQLVKVLVNRSGAAEHRARAAYLLADHRHIIAVNALVDAVASDSNLDVVREASLTFSEMTGYRSEQLLDAPGLVDWWQKNSSVVKLALGK